MKGIATVWLEVLAGIFVVGLVYIIMSYVLYGQITPVIYPKLAAINETVSGVNVTAMQTTINIINVVWIVWPLIFIFGLIFWGIVRSQKREYETAYG